MLKRPLNPQFSAAVLAGRKVTTIRSKPWPVWKDIMLYNWSGAAYRSKQVDVAAIIVESENEIIITNVDGGMVFTPDSVDGIPIYKTEGFDSWGDMNDWFSALIKPGETEVRHLMRFRLANS